MSDHTVECSKSCSKDREKKHYHCYLLKSLDPKHPYKTYIGYTTNPQRRIRQHNGDLKNGGARRTRRQGRPWTFALIIHGFQDETSALKFEWAWQHPHRSTIFRSGLPNGSAALAKVLDSRRGVKARLHLAQVLLCESTPYKKEALTLYFFDERDKATFESLFIKDSSFDEDEQDPWCEALPSQMSCNRVDRFDEMPFSIDIAQNRKDRSKIHSKSKAKKPDDSSLHHGTSSNEEEEILVEQPSSAFDQANQKINEMEETHFLKSTAENFQERSKIRRKAKSKISDNGSMDDTSSSNVEDEFLVELSSSSIDQANINELAKQNGSVSHNEIQNFVIDMTDVYSIASDTTSTNGDTSCCDDTVDLLSPSFIGIDRSSRENKNLNQREEDSLKINVTLSFDDTVSESLSPNLKEFSDRGKGIMRKPQGLSHDVLDVKSLCDNTSDSDQTIDLGPDLDQTIDLCSP